ncbi:ATPase inhibitor subunit zeta [Telmatospirillum siberiense]|nr:ATPase inhibitor subunit zeta [Telmatospirillum siberiense]
MLDITHRRNRLAGLWAAELLGLIGIAAQDYVRTVVHPGHPQDQVHGDDHETVVDKLAEDLAGRASEEEIRRRMSQCLQEARRRTELGKKE